MIVAVFTIAVDDEDIVKTVWEKTLTHDQLSEHIAKSHQTNRILQKVIPDRPNSNDSMIKQEPIGRIKDRKNERKRDKADKREGFKKGVCIRCGDKWTKSHMEKCPAKSKKCNNCKKEGHLAKMCKSEHKKSHIRRVEEEESSDSEESETVSQDSEEETSTPSGVNTSSDSFDERSIRQTKKTNAEREKRKSRISRLKEKVRTENRELIGKLTCNDR